MLGRLCADGSQSCNLHLVSSLKWPTLAIRYPSHSVPQPFGTPASPHSLRQLPYSGPAEPCSAHLCRSLSGCDWSSFKPVSLPRRPACGVHSTNWGRPPVYIGPGASTDSKPERITKNESEYVLLTSSTHSQSAPRFPCTLRGHLSMHGCGNLVLRFSFTMQRSC
jgi:hypothetical protein